MLQTVRQVLYIATLALVAITGATGGLDAQTTAGVVAQLLALVAAGTALTNVPLPLPKSTPAGVAQRPTLTGQTIAGLVADVFSRLMFPSGPPPPTAAKPPPGKSGNG